MHLAVFGSGYVGLVAGACLADAGNEVICVDINKEKIDRLNKGIIPIYEPGLEDIIQRNVKEERLIFTVDAVDAIHRSKVIFIAVGTPPDEDGSADLKHVINVAKMIGKNMKDFKIIVNKSTVPVGTAEKVTAEIKKHTNLEFAVVSNPEFLKEGDAVNDFMKPDRVIIGTSNADAADLMRTIYLPFVRTGRPVIVMDEKSAELTKYAIREGLTSLES